MNKQFYIYFAFAGAAIFVFILLFIGLLSSRSGSQGGNSPTPGTTSTPGTQEIGPLSVINALPSNNETGVSPTTQIIITFDRNIQNNTIPITIVPQIPFSQSANNNVLTISPQTNLSAGTQYFVRVFLNGASDRADVDNFSFTTVGPTPTGLPDTRDQNLINSQTEFQREQQTDVYLANNTPYSGSDFSVSNNFIPGDPSGHFQFTVTLSRDPTAAKSDFITWLHSLQLTDQEIQTLDIVYQ